MSIGAAKAIAEGTYLNEYRKNRFSKVSLEYRPIFKKIARLSGSNEWRDCFYLTPDEMISILDGRKIDIFRIKKERKIVGILTIKQGRPVFLAKRKTMEIYNYLQILYGIKKESDIKKSFVKGMSANNGKARGIAKIVLSSKDFYKIKRGDILITTMTSVDFVPVMEKAAAFVTNEGGITSHASIVSREMNKPCIVGTKIATKIFEDGDLVEVDANKGIVKILKRK